MAAIKVFLANMKKFVHLLIIFLVFIQTTAIANQDKTEIEFITKDNITNEIPYFENRFRIDAEVDEITLLFYHQYGATPVILVQPNGAKIRVNNYDKKHHQKNKSRHRNSLLDH